MRVFLVLLAALAVPSLASAQDPAPAIATHAHVLDEIIIVATPQRPSAFYLLSRAHVRFDRVEDTHHAVDRIIESVRHEPF